MFPGIPVGILGFQFEFLDSRVDSGIPMYFFIFWHKPLVSSVVLRIPVWILILQCGFGDFRVDSGISVLILGYQYGFWDSSGDAGNSI